MNKQLREQLKALKNERNVVSPRAEWVASQREQLLGQIKNTVSEERHVPVFTRISNVFTVLFSSQRLLAMRGAFVFLLVIGLATGGLVASASPLPRDILFNVKVAVATVTGNEQAKGKLHLEEANYQTQELQRKLATGNEEDKKDVEKQLKKIKKQVESAKETLKKANEGDKKEATALAKDVTKETTTIAKSLKEVSVSVGNDPSAKELVQVRQDVVDAGIDALSVLSDVITTPESDIAQEEVEEIQHVLEEKIVVILQEAEDVGKDIQETKGQVEQQAEDDDSVDDMSSTTVDILDVSTSTSGTLKTAEETSKEEVTRNIQVLSDQAEKSEQVALQVKALLEGKQVTQAIEAVKQLTTLTKESEAVLINVKQVIPPIPSISPSGTIQADAEVFVPIPADKQVESNSSATDTSL